MTPFDLRPIFQSQANGRGKAYHIENQASESLYVLCSKSTDNTMELSEHGIVAAAEFKVTQEAYKKVVESLVTVPKEFHPATESGIVFYLAGGGKEGDKGGAVILDRLRFNSGVLNLKFIMVIDAQKVPLSALKPYVDKHIEASLSALGLEFEKDT